jgi:O-antigen/teichoic acid export membrane protein
VDKDMAVNGSELIENPWDTLWSPFIDIFGVGFWLIPIGIIAVALFMKTREVTVSSIWILVSCFLVGTGVFVEHPEIGFVYYLFAVLGLVGTIVSIFFMKE